MRFYARSHSSTCGVDLHRRTMYLCVLDAEGQIVLHRKLPCRPEAFLAAVEPYRAALVVGCECLFSWYWLADLCQEAGIDFVLGHALGMRLIHGTKTKNDKLDSEKIARLLHSGHFPLAYVYPRATRATRDLLRRMQKRKLPFDAERFYAEGSIDRGGAPASPSSKSSRFRSESDKVRTRPRAGGRTSPTNAPETRRSDSPPN